MLDKTDCQLGGKMCSLVKEKFQIDVCESGDDVTFSVTQHHLHGLDKLYLNVSVNR